jgi:hypothetical protein
MSSGQGSDINDLVGCPDYILVVLHNDYGIAQVAKRLKYFDKVGGIFRMESDTGFVEDIHGPYQTAAQGRSQVYSLAFTSGEGIGFPVKAEVAQSHFFKET